MNYTVLARKYRPKKFTDLIGQESNITILKNIIQNKRLHHAYLLTGTRGIGKTTIARIIAKALNCLNLNGSDPCCICDICTQIDAGRFTDVIEIDAASNTGVDNIRDLIDNTAFTPIAGTYKVYIIDEVHMLSRSAFNAMLKILEEPPRHVIFILATTDAHKVPITVLSRCLQLKLRHLLTPEISSHMASILQLEGINYAVNALDLIAASSTGSMRDALSLLDQAIAFSMGSTSKIISEESVRQMLGLSDDAVIYQLLDSIINIQTKELHRIAVELYNTGYDLVNVLENLSNILCNISIAQLTGITSVAKNQSILLYVGKISVNNVQLYFEICNLGLEQIKDAHNKFTIFIMTLLRMVAFNIGSGNIQEIVVNQSDYMVNTSSNIINEDNSTIANTSDCDMTSDIAHENKTITTITFEKDFDNDWFKLIDKIKPQLGYLYPFLENSKLINFSNKICEITIDDRYAAGLNETCIIELNKIFSIYFSDNITFKINFTKNINNTLKAKIQSYQQDIQNSAETAMYDDVNLSRILDAFSATISTGSIKPI
jgi:DNA polymerase-3 subunit gamma/tau